MNIEIADRLVQLRRTHNLSQEELAGKLGVSRQAISKWERAESSPDTDNLIALARLYGVSLDELLLHTPGAGSGATAQAVDTQAPDDCRGEEEEASILSAARQWDAADDAYAEKRRKRLKKMLFVMPYPIIVTILYLFLGFTLHWWHPGWMLYLTIPIYYCTVAAL